LKCGDWDRATVTGNRITGTASAGISIVSDDLEPSLLATGNGFFRNDVRRFRAHQAGYLLGETSVDTLGRGNCRSYADLGLTNEVSCGEPVLDLAPRRSSSSVGAPRVRRRPALLEPGMRVDASRGTLAAGQMRMVERMCLSAIVRKT
jgi:hypothetical protein